VDVGVVASQAFENVLCLVPMPVADEPPWRLRNRQHVDRQSGTRDRGDPTIHRQL
jgi:hypothetical protein